MKMIIREAKEGDFDEIWQIFHEISAVGETYAYPRDIRLSERHNARRSHKGLDRIAPKDLCSRRRHKNMRNLLHKTNQLGGGSHVCNCATWFLQKQEGKD
jgi:hypothetical protein